MLPERALSTDPVKQTWNVKYTASEFANATGTNTCCKHVADQCDPCPSGAVAVMQETIQTNEQGTIKFTVARSDAAATSLGTAAKSSIATRTTGEGFGVMWRNATAPLAARLDDLLPRLTLDDLVAQLGGPGVGDIVRPNLTLPGSSWGQECLSGVGHGANSSAFPLPVALGMAFDTELVRAVGSAIGDEARALFNARKPGSSLLCLSPVCCAESLPNITYIVNTATTNPFVLRISSTRFVMLRRFLM